MSEPLIYKFILKVGPNCLNLNNSDPILTVCFKLILTLNHAFYTVLNKNKVVQITFFFYENSK